MTGVIFTSISNSLGYRMIELSAEQRDKIRKALGDPIKYGSNLGSVAVHNLQNGASTRGVVVAVDRAEDVAKIQQLPAFSQPVKGKRHPDNVVMVWTGPEQDMPAQGTDPVALMGFAEFVKLVENRPQDQRLIQMEEFRVYAQHQTQKSKDDGPAVTAGLRAKMAELRRTGKIPERRAVPTPVG